MLIDKVGLTDFRNIKRADLETGSPFVIIAGHNAAGKTSVLEAIYLALAGRSFRTREWTKVINYQKNEMFVTVSSADNFVGALRKKGSKPLHKFNGEEVALSEIAKKFPIQLFDISLFDLFDGSSRSRRQLIDWALFHVKQGFYPVWCAYHKVLKQRNSLLKQPVINSTHSLLDSWDKELVKHANKLSVYREEYTSILVERCSRNSLLKEIELNVDYFPGWQGADKSFAISLFESRQRDLKYKRTMIGPHHADLKITANTKKAGDSLSRGQKKIAGFAIKLEQVKMYNEEFDSPCLILCDDFTAELDVDNQRKILEYMLRLESQVFMTVIDSKSILPMMPNLKDTKVFHVKQGVFLS